MADMHQFISEVHVHAALTAALGEPAPFKLAQALIAHGDWLHALVVLKHSQFNLLTHRGVCCTLLKKLQELLKTIPQSGPMPPDAAVRLLGKPTAAEKALVRKEPSIAAGAEFTPLMMQMLEVWY
jgi:hypothetical protein